MTDSVPLRLKSAPYSSSSSSWAFTRCPTGLDMLACCCFTPRTAQSSSTSEPTTEYMIGFLVAVGFTGDHDTDVRVSFQSVPWRTTTRSWIVSSKYMGSLLQSLMSLTLGQCRERYRFVHDANVGKTPSVIEVVAVSRRLHVEYRIIERGTSLVSSKISVLTNWIQKQN